MHENFEDTTALFRAPNVSAEIGEFERVGEKFVIDPSVLMYLAQDGQMLELDDEMWQKLDNTDSNDVGLGAWHEVAAHADQVGRDWQQVRDVMQAGKAIDAPIVMQFGANYHLVSGNTRLMVARALGITPKILLFSIDMPDGQYVAAPS